MGKLIAIQIRYNEHEIQEIDKLIKQGIYKNRADAVRHATRLLLREHNRRDGKYDP